MTATILQKPSENLTPKSYYTPEEYLAFEENSEFKHEYRNGEIVPMTGGTTNHNEIAGNFYSNLKIALKGQNYRVFFADVRLWIPRYNNWVLSDIDNLKNIVKLESLKLQISLQDLYDNVDFNDSEENK